MNRKSNAMVKAQFSETIATIKANGDLLAQCVSTLEQIYRLMAASRGGIPLAITQEDVIRRATFACREAGVPKSAFSRKTLQRMEQGMSTTRAGYTATVRHSEATFLAWLRCYIAEETARLRPDKAQRFNDNLARHNNRG